MGQLSSATADLSSSSSAGMPYSLGDYLQCLAPRLVPGILDARRFADLATFARTIPGPVSSFFGFECPLGHDSRTADFLFCSTQVEGHAAILAGQHPRIRLPDTGFDSEAWAKALHFCREWERSDSPLYQQLLNIWLEFDIGSAPPPWQPSLFFGPELELARDPVRAQALITQCLSLLTPEAVEGARGQCLNRLLEALPAHAYVFQVGMMLARTMPAIRVCIRGLAGREIVDLLQATGWQGDAAELQAVIDTYSTDCTYMDLDVDVGADLGDKVGLECSFGRDAETLSRIQAHFAQLAGDALLTPAEQTGLLAYNGLVHEDDSQHEWHPRLRTLSALQGPNVVSFLACWVHHTKIVWQPGKPLSAKAYLAAQADRIDRGELRRRFLALNS